MDGNGPGNRTTIAIEICYSKSGGARFDKAEENAAELIADLLKKYGWDISVVKRHYDYAPDKKYCPHRTMDKGWDRFLNMIKAKLEDNPISNEVNVYYRVKTQKHGWLSEVKNLEDYAGWENSPITGLAIKVDKGSIKYRVHIKGGNWLPYVTGYNTNDSNNGYAGIIGKPIDGIRMYAEKTTTQVVTPTPAPTPAPSAIQMNTFVSAAQAPTAASAEEPTNWPTMIESAILYTC